MRIKSIANWKTLLIGALASTLIACGGGSDSSSTNSGPVYTAIIDAGSSGTRISFYKVIPSQGGYPQITLIDSNSYDDNGINDFILGTGSITLTSFNNGALSNDLPGGTRPTGCTGGTLNTDSDGAQTITGLGPNDVGPCVLQPLYNSISADMTKYGVSSSQVKVELFATAGMRTVAYKNGGTKSDGEIDSFYQTMKTYTAGKNFTVGEFRTSNGNKEEGIWTWVNLNDQYYNAFGGNPTYSTNVQSPVGDFEVGGSSMQVVFPYSATPSDANNVYSVSINGKSFTVYSKTFLGLGGDDTRKFMRSAGYNSGSGSYAFNGGTDCYASSANSSNTSESSGIALFYNSALYMDVLGPIGNPNANLASSTWLTTIANTEFPMTWNSQVGTWNPVNCSARYNAITNAVISLPRNSDGTLNDGSTTTYDALRNRIGSTSVSFVGLDGFYWPANSLNLDQPTGFSATIFASTLNAKCSSPISGKFSAQRVCPDGSYMNDFLFRTGGLFNNNGAAKFVGVQPNKLDDGTTVLTWTRGYLLLKYAN